jgi:ubiquinone/menaquinone biosynthesis C-methylase UbiE
MEESDSINLSREEVLRMGKAKGKTLLDIGVGALTIIAARDFNCMVTTIDISEDKLIQVASEVPEDIRKRIKFEKNDAADLPYPDNSFEIVISYGALHHIDPDRRKDFINEAARVAKEKIVIADFNPDYFDKVHSKDSYHVVDFNWLEKELSLRGILEKHPGKEMSAFVLKIKSNTGIKDRKI